MARLEELPDITDPRFQPVWLIAVNRTAKKLGRTPSSDEIVNVYAELLPNFTEPDGSVNTAKKVFTLPELPYAYPDMPGLILREMNAEDIELIIPRMAYKDAETARSAVMTRVNDPFTQMLAWEFRRRLVQTESLRLKPDGSVEIGTAVHMMHRTSEFWREIEKPVFERLLAVGAKEMSTLTLNSLLKYWKPIIVDVYKGKAGRVSPLTTQFTYPLDLSVFKGRPERRTADPGWSYKYKNMTFREMSPSELPQVMAAIQSWHKAGKNVANLFEEKYVLDRAAVLLGFIDDELAFVRAIRPRSKDSGGNYALYSRLYRRFDEHVMRYASNLWFKALGYEKVTSFAQTGKHSHAAIDGYLKNQPHLQTGPVFIDHGVQMLPIITKVSDVLQYSIDEWVDKYTDG